MNIIPLYKFGSRILIGLDTDFTTVPVQDSLVVELDLNSHEIMQPWSCQKKLKFDGLYETVIESDREILANQITEKVGKSLIDEIIDMLLYPQKESIETLVWLPERLKKLTNSEVYRTSKNRFTEFLLDENNIENEFVRLADLILLEKNLRINNYLFWFTEIEFYYYCEVHQDAFTHQHNESAKKWRFHNQGFDITLRGDSGYGGILIRGVEHLDSNILETERYVNGPRRVLFEIMRYLNPVDQPANIFGLVTGKKRDLQVFKTFRHGLNTPDPTLKCDRPEFFRDANYRFIVNPQKSQITDRENIARSFNDSKLSFDFLGYTLKQ